jgi:sn-glycerol 3-phosphate transport system ATP-binding protein
MIKEPKVFLFDEPLSNLDAKLRVQMRIEIRKLHQRLKATSVFVTHDQVEAMTLADRLVVMNKGVVEQVGTPKEVYDHPATTFVAGFIGAPGMNLLPAEVSADSRHVVLKDGQRLALDPVAHAGATPGPVTVGVRAEALHLGAHGQHGLKTEFEFAEELGVGRHLHVAVAGATMVVHVESGRAFGGGDPLVLEAAPAALHLFDAQSGERLAARGRVAPLSVAA